MSIDRDRYAAGGEDSSSTRGTSGWEVVDTGLSIAGEAARGVGWIILKLYALALIAVGIAVLLLLGDAWWGGLLFLGYGLYLLFGGSWVIY